MVEEVNLLKADVDEAVQGIEESLDVSAEDVQEESPDIEKAFEDDMLQMILEMANKESFDPDFFETEDGTKIPIKKLSPYVFDILRSSEDAPDKPTYEVKLVTGETQTFEHDQESIKNASEEEKKEWEDYHKEIERLRKTAQETVERLILYRAVDLELPEDDDWIEEQRWIGLNPPVKNKRELKLHWVKTELLSSGDDIKRLMSHVLVASGVGREDKSTIKRSFPDQMGRQTDRRSGPETNNGTGRRVPEVEIKRRLDV